jgi:membrane protein YqaA with SNARE-associated domain
MLWMVVTELVFHVPMGALKAVAPANAENILDMDAVFHEPIGALKAVAFWKALFMPVTADVFQPAILASLKELHPLKHAASVVTLDSLGSDAGH